MAVIESEFDLVIESEFDSFVYVERVRILPIVAACRLTGDWGNSYGCAPYEFLVDGEPPVGGCCPNCQSPLSEPESIDSGDWNVEFWLGCDGCGLFWYNGEERCQ